MRFGRFFFGIGVVCLSFYLTLQAIDRGWLPAPQVLFSNGSAPDARSPLPVTKSTAIFSLNLAVPNWSAATEKSKVSIVGNVIVMTSTAGKFEYQWTTLPIATVANTDYIASYEIVMKRGKVSLGVMDDVNQTFIVVKDVSSPTDTIPFKAPTGQIRLVLFNSDDVPLSTTNIIGLSVTPANGK